jgi:hypothetical protein
MNLFRSEEHVRNWSGFKSGTEGGILTLPEVSHLFSGDTFTRRADPDYVSHGGYVEPFIKALTELAKTRPFWSLV